MIVVHHLHVVIESNGGKSTVTVGHLEDIACGIACQTISRLDWFIPDTIFVAQQEGPMLFKCTLSTLCNGAVGVIHASKSTIDDVAAASARYLL
jgi:hypothetical protein